MIRFFGFKKSTLKITHLCEKKNQSALYDKLSMVRYIETIRAPDTLTIIITDLISVTHFNH